MDITQTSTYKNPYSPVKSYYAKPEHVTSVMKDHYYDNPQFGYHARAVYFCILSLRNSLGYATETQIKKTLKNKKVDVDAGLESLESLDLIAIFETTNILLI